MKLDGVETTVSPEAVVVTADHALTVVSSSSIGGGFARARTIVNLHVGKDFTFTDGETVVSDLLRRHALPSPSVGLFTAASTDRAEIASESAAGIAAVVIATVGLSNASTAGLTGRAATVPGTINIIVVVDAEPTPAAMVNLVMTVTEVKTAVLLEAGLKSLDGYPATGTSTDAVAVAATGRGPRCRFGGPMSDVGWIVACAARRAIGTGVRRWCEDHR